jgi:PAS domain S-box-containing protein
LLEKSFASDSKPIIKNNLLIGTVHIYVTDNDAKERLRKYVLYIIIQMTTLSVIIALSIFITLRRRIVNPLISLDKSVRSISSDNLDHFTEINRNDEIGRLSRSFNVMVDVLRQSFRERDALNLEVIKREEQFLAIVSNVPRAIYRISLSAVQTVLYMSERIFGITGISAEELVGSSPEIFRALVHENDREILNSAVRCAVDKNTPYDVRYRITYRNGDVRWLHEIGQCCSVGDERYLDGVIIDETELREKDYLLVQSQKMETVGTLAGGIAHDFNNILSGIMGGVSMMKMKLPDLPQDCIDSVSKYISLIEKSSLRAVEMTRQLLSLSKRQELRLSPVDLNEPVKQVAQICQNTLDKSVSIEIESAGVPAFVNADAVQIEQLLLNLCVNAAHAMTFMRPAAVRWGGVINISLKKFQADKLFC